MSKRMSEERLKHIKDRYDHYGEAALGGGELLAEIDALRAELAEAERNWAEQEKRGTIAQTDLNIALNKLAAAEQERDRAREALTGLELKFAERAEGQRQWISENAPYISHDQKHLNAGTVERAYWHYGYCIALGDVIGQIKTTIATLESTPTAQGEP